MSLDDICIQYECAVSQRKTEVDAGLGTKGTMGYELIGCYDGCFGFNEKCPQYVSLKMLGED